jgi:hypothetical protein
MVLPQPGNEASDAYASFVQKFTAAATTALKDAVEPDVVARTIVQASRDTNNRMRYPVGKPAPLLLRLRNILSDGAFFSMIRKAYKL